MNLIKDTKHKMVWLTSAMLLSGGLFLNGCAPEADNATDAEPATETSSTVSETEAGSDADAIEETVVETETNVEEVVETKDGETITLTKDGQVLTTETPETAEAEEAPSEKKPVEEAPAEEKELADGSEPVESEKPAEPTEPAEKSEPADEPVEAAETEKPAEPTEKTLPVIAPRPELADASTPAEEEKPAEEPKPEETEPAEEPEAVADASDAEEKPADGNVTGDWPMWGGDINRNMINATKGITIELGDGEVAESEAVKWISELGSQTYGNPTVADGKVLVGTNNGAEYRPQFKGDMGVVLCFDEKSGEMLWQLTREKLPQGRVNDWPEQGICSTPCIEDGRMWVVTNRAEVMCVDMEGFHDGENDGPYTEEVATEDLDADIIWSLDMIEELGVFPHNLATSSPLIYKDRIFLLTSNGVDEAHLEIPSPRSPCFLCLDKNTGEIIWEDNSPFNKILHGQWGSPAIGEVNGQTQVYFPGGDGWLYAFDADADEANIIWKFDMNPKDSKWVLGAEGTRNAIISTPVFLENSVVLGVGQDPEHGEGTGHLYRIDATKEGDISPAMPDGSENPNSGQIWHYGGSAEDGSDIYRRTISTAAIHDGLVYAADLSGFLHCVDFKTGEPKWNYDLFAAVWGSPMVVDGKILIGDEDGDLAIIPVGPELNEDEIKEFYFPSSIYSTPTIANGTMFISDRSHLYSIPIVK